MIRLALLLALLLAGGAFAQDTARDDSARQREFSMPPFAVTLAYEFRAVGRVNKAGFRARGNCTGTLVAPDAVLTAGHCAGPVRKVAEDIEEARIFVAGYSRGEYLAARRIVEAVRHPAYLIGDRHDPRFDIGLLFLESPITEVEPMKMGEPVGDVVGIAGYHQFIPHLLTGRLNCPVLARDERLLRIDCPVVSGNSGGPVLEPDGAGGWQVTAVVSSQEKGPDYLRALAVRIPQWVHDVLAER